MVKAISKFKVEVIKVKLSKKEREQKLRRIAEIIVNANAN